VTSCVRQKICFERVTAFSLPLLLKKEERAGERRRFLSISLLSDSLPLIPREEREAKRSRRFACRTQLVCDSQRLGCLESVRISRERLENSGLLRLTVPRSGARVCDSQQLRKAGRARMIQHDEGHRGAAAHKTAFRCMASRSRRAHP